jgi:hypothetical protein
LLTRTITHAIFGHLLFANISWLPTVAVIVDPELTFDEHVSMTNIIRASHRQLPNSVRVIGIISSVVVWNIQL